MADLMQTVTPWLEWIRIILLKLSEFIAGGLNLDPVNVHLFVMIGVSFYVGKQIFGIFYSSTEGRVHYLLLIVGIIFYILKYL